MNGDQVEVEVTIDMDVYRAFVEDITANGLEVSFENNWRPPGLFHFKDIRFPFYEDDGHLETGLLVEVRLKDAAKNVTFWRKAILLGRSNTGTSKWRVEYFTNDRVADYPTHISMDDIRKVNKKLFPIGPSTLEKIEIEIPRHLRKIAATAGIHDDFRKDVLAASCKFISKTNVLRLFSKNGEFTRKKVDLFKNSHVKFLENQSPTSPYEAAKFTELIEVDKKFIGLALGKKYANIREARQIKGITSVELIKDTLCIEVCGKTAEAVKAARDMLDYHEHLFDMPRYLAEVLLEDDGKKISDIVVKSGLVRIESGEDDDDDESEDYPIVFVGNPPCIEIAKELLENQLELIDRKLKNMSTSGSESTISNDPDIIIDRIKLKKKLVGLALGHNSANLEKARKIPGIVKIICPQYSSVITIHAQNKAAAQAARRLLEYGEETVEVDRNSIGKIIGKGGVTVKQIESLSEGVRVRIPSKIDDSNTSVDNKVSIKVCGPAHKIPDTIFLIRTAEVQGHL